MACAATALAGLTVKRPLLGPVAQGIAAAWAASTASVAALIFARGRSMKAFWWAFGGGMALRAAVLTALMIHVWDAHWERQGAVLGAYALGVLFLLLLEYRNLARE